VPKSKAAETAMPPAVLVKGDDPSLVGQAVRELTKELLAGRDPSTVVEEHTEQTSDYPGAGPVVDAISTPPFLGDLRIVVVRDAGRFPASESERIAAALGDPVAGVVLVVAAGGGTVSAVLQKAIERVGRVIDTKVPTGRGKGQWLQGKLKDAPVKLDARAGARIGEHLGDDLGRLEGLLGSLASAYGGSQTISEEDLEPFLGSAGGLPAWDLTDAIDKGDSEAALGVLQRISAAQGGAALLTLSILHRHYAQMLRLDGSGVTSGAEAAAAIGARSEYPAKKALDQSRVLGYERIARAISLLADADLDLRGQSGLSDEAVLQVLVARLSRLTPASRRQGSRRRA
jgi:DNA polymerase III subunit delta